MGGDALQLALVASDGLEFCMTGHQKWDVVIANKSLMYAFDQLRIDGRPALAIDDYVAHTFAVGSPGSLLITDQDTLRQLFASESPGLAGIRFPVLTSRYQYQSYPLNSSDMGNSRLFGIHVSSSRA